MRKPGLDICNTQHAVQCDSPALSTGFNVSYISTCGLLFLTCKMPLFLSQSCRGFWHTMLSHKTGAKTWSEALVHSKSTKHWSPSLNFKYSVISLILLNRKQTNTNSETDLSRVKKKKGIALTNTSVLMQIPYGNGRALNRIYYWSVRENF